MAQLTAIDSVAATNEHFKREDDIQLLRRISNKDSSALSSLYDIHSKYLYTIIYFILKDESEAEDLLQEVFLQIWDKVELYDETIGSPMSWITRVTRNKSIDKLRSKTFRNRYIQTDIEDYDFFEETGTSNPEKNSMYNQEKEEITNALKTLNQNQLSLIDYAYFRGFSQSEIAGHLNIPLGTVKTRMRSAVLALREKLKYML